MLRPNDHRRHQAGTPTETPIREGICRWNQEDGRSRTRTVKGGRKNRRRALPHQKSMNGSCPEEGLGSRVLSKRRGIRHRDAGFSLQSPQPEECDLYITSGIQTMALSRKRPSAGSLMENDHEDSRPSKETATSTMSNHPKDSLSPRVVTSLW